MCWYHTVYSVLLYSTVNVTVAVPYVYIAHVGLYCNYMAKYLSHTDLPIKNINYLCIWITAGDGCKTKEGQPYPSYT